MKKPNKSVKTQRSTAAAGSTSAGFAQWLRSIPQGSDGKVTIQPPISLTQSHWALLAVDAARQNMTLNDLLQGSINTFVGMVQEDLSKAA